MSDRTCARNCTQKGIHYATCADYGMQDAFERAREAGVPGVSFTPTCTGCAPRECRDGSLICDRCFGRARRLLDDLPDLIARLRSLADPSKATPTDKAPGGGQPSEPAAAVGSDLLDAIIACETVWSWWMQWREDLPLMSNRTDALWLFDVILDRHEPHDGIRESWSVQDAVDTWSVERRPGRHEKPWEDDEPGSELATFGVAEWGENSLITKRQAEVLAGSRQTLERWVSEEHLANAGRFVIGGVRTQMFRASEVVAVKKAMKGKTGGRPREEAS